MSSLHGSVVPVVDYEPPLRRERPATSAAAPRPRPAPPPRPHPTPPPAETAAARAAGAFADAALRRVLEVIDRRRPLAQLRPLLAGGLVDSLLSVPHRHGGEAARLRRIRVQPIGTAGAAAEVAATYTRGRRLHAIACRVQRVDTGTGPRWQVVALHIG
ncbi:MAG: Rv3235 family protein [Mycobacterium sp.]